MFEFLTRKYLFLFFTCVVFNLKSNTIQGLIFDEQQKPIEFANIILHEKNNPSNLNGTMSDSTGKFIIENLNDGEYFFEVIYLGYKTDTSTFFVLKGNELKDFNVITLKVENNLLDGVEIKANKPIIERKADRLVYNVENSAKSSGENVLELLRSVPGVTVSGNQQIRVNGKSEVQVMINGKIQQMTADQLANLLKSIQSSNVKKIEVISNASSKYDANAKGGILDIQLKSNLKSGFNGSIFTSYRQNKYASSENGFNFNINYKKISINTVYNIGYNNNENNSSFIRNFNINDTIQQFNETSRNKNHAIYNYANLNLRYSINEKNTFGFGSEFVTFKNPNNTNSHLNIFNDINSDIINNIQKTNTITNNKNINPSANIYFKSILDSNGSYLDFKYDYLFFKLFTKSHLNTKFFDNNMIENQTPLDFTQENPFVVNLHTAKLDYYKPLKNKNIIECGGKFTWTKTNNNIQFFNLILDNYIKDSTKSNEFRYIENINALYFSWSKEWKNNWSTNIGIRTEQTNTNQKSITLNNVNTRHYIDFFPSVFIQKSIKDKHSININYSRKIQRPNFKDLNPFEFYNSQYSIWSGNANLKPLYINITEFTYTFDNAYSFFIGHENMNNSYTYLAFQNDSTKTTKYVASNFKQRNNLNIGININKDFFKWWNVGYSFQYTFFKYNAIVNNSEYKLSSNKFNFSLDNTFVLPKNFTVNLFAYFVSPHLDATDVMKIDGMLNISIAKSFFDKKLNIRLAGNDLLHTQNFSFDTNFANIDSEIRNQWNSRSFVMTITYNFQKGKQFNNSNLNKGNQEEKSRIG